MNDKLVKTFKNNYLEPENCWEPCGKKSGYCPSFCKANEVCCRKGFGGDPIECQGASIPCVGYHCCSTKPPGIKKIMDSQ